MAFFGAFPKTKYDYPGHGNTEIVDLFRSASAIDSGVDRAATYQVYSLGDQRPDQLAEELYGNPELHWTFFVANVHLRNGWPLSYSALENYIAKKYNGFAMTLYRTDVNVSVIGGVETPGDEPESNTIAGGFPIGSIITGAGHPAIATAEAEDIPAIYPSGATAEIIGRSPDTNTLYFRYTSDNIFTDGEQFLVRDSNNETYNINEKYLIQDWKAAPHHYEDANGEYITNQTNLNYSDFSVSYNTYESDLNDDRKNIRIIREEYIEDFVIAYRKAINE